MLLLHVQWSRRFMRCCCLHVFLCRRRTKEQGAFPTSASIGQPISVQSWPQCSYQDSTGIARPFLIVGKEDSESQARLPISREFSSQYWALSLERYVSLCGVSDISEVLLLTFLLSLVSSKLWRHELSLIPSALSFCFFLLCPGAEISRRTASSWSKQQQSESSEQQSRTKRLFSSSWYEGGSQESNIGTCKGFLQEGHLRLDKNSNFAMPSGTFGSSRNLSSALHVLLAKITLKSSENLISQHSSRKFLNKET